MINNISTAVLLSTIALASSVARADISHREPRLYYKCDEISLDNRRDKRIHNITINSTIDEVHVNLLLKKSKEYNRDTPMLELETDKVTYDVTCPISGTVLEVDDSHLQDAISKDSLSDPIIIAKIQEPGKKHQTLVSLSWDNPSKKGLDEAVKGYELSLIGTAPDINQLEKGARAVQSTTIDVAKKEQSAVVKEKSAIDVAKKEQSAVLKENSDSDNQEKNILFAVIASALALLSGVIFRKKILSFIKRFRKKG